MLVFTSATQHRVKYTNALGQGRRRGVPLNETTAAGLMRTDRIRYDQEQLQQSRLTILISSKWPKHGAYNPLAARPKIATYMAHNVFAAQGKAQEQELGAIPNA